MSTPQSEMLRPEEVLGRIADDYGAGVYSLAYRWWEYLVSVHSPDFIDYQSIRACVENGEEPPAWHRLTAAEYTAKMKATIREIAVTLGCAVPTYCDEAPNER